MLNKVQLIGRVGQEPEQKILSSGNTLVNLSLATNERWRDKAGAIQERTSWHRITLWAGQANFAIQYIHKGDLIYVEGRIDYQEWEKNGVKQYGTSIIAQSIQKLSWDKKQNQADAEFKPSWEPAQTELNNSPPVPTDKPASHKPIFGNVNPVGDLLEDDIPF